VAAELPALKRVAELMREKPRWCFAATDLPQMAAFGWSVVLCTRKRYGSDAHCGHRRQRPTVNVFMPPADFRGRWWAFAGNGHIVLRRGRAHAVRVSKRDLPIVTLVCLKAIEEKTSWLRWRSS